ncbi:hypothetical protein O3M35_006239 [Rhynocoris fuscipes]|uniref:Uncharacterized protein n=1 Tax=Rhynocoris fuscipes TaxID=488301 RepID=A0AAW1DCN9_9HEMI
MLELRNKEHPSLKEQPEWGSRTLQSLANVVPRGLAAAIRHNNNIVIIKLPIKIQEDPR